MFLVAHSEAFQWLQCLHQRYISILSQGCINLCLRPSCTNMGQMCKITSCCGGVAWVHDGNAYMIKMMDVRDQSVSVWMDAVPANSRSALSLAQLSPLQAWRHIRCWRLQLRRTELPSEISCPALLPLEVELWVTCSVRHYLFFNKKRKGKSLICFNPSLQSASTRVTKTITSVKRKTDSFK